MPRMETRTEIDPATRPRQASRGAYAVFGIVATAFGAALGHLVAALLHPDSSPVLAVGSAIIDRTPADVKEWAIRTFDSDGFSIGPVELAARNYDKVVLLGSVGLVVLGAAAVVGVLARRSLRLGVAMMVGLVVLAAVAVLSRPVVTVVDLIPSVVTALAGVGALLLLDRKARRARTAPDALSEDAGEGTPAAHPSRRGVLLWTGVLTASAAVLGGAGRWIGGLRTEPEQITLPRPAAGQALPPVPRGLEASVDGISPLQTPNGDFYRVDTRLDVPVVSSEDWSLVVDGDVERRLEIGFEELMTMPMVERDITLTCVSNSVGGQYVGAARWLGVPLLDILDRAGIGSDADQMVATDFDGMTIGTPLDLLRDGREPLLCVGMNGEPLPREHGFPVRVVVPGLYGFISATKWVTRLTMTSYAETEAYWTARGWDERAPIKPSARIDTPRALAELDAGTVVVGGVAWAQDDRGVRTVQVQVDGGRWMEASLGPDLGSLYWRQWYLEVELEPGQHTLAARMVDGEDDVQTAVRAAPFPGGASGIHSFFVTVR